MSDAVSSVPLEWFDLAAESLGGAVLWANDDFFAEKDNLLRAAEPVWKEDAYTDRGKWMDGWESRRRRTPGHDWCHVRLGVAGRIHRVLVNTAFFRGNYPESCSIEACVATPDATTEYLENEAVWQEVLPQSPLQGNSENWFDVEDHHRYTHLRFHIYPDGGVARLRVYGAPIPDPAELDRAGEVDLASMLWGATTLQQSDMFFGRSQNLLKPQRGVNMGDGWETRRRRGPGHDWVLLKLAAEGIIERVEVDTNHFKGNYPDRFSLEASAEPPADPQSDHGTELCPQQKLMAHTRHFVEVAKRIPARHAVLRIYPDGGVSRLRLWGRLTDAGRRDLGLAALNAQVADAAKKSLTSVCGSTAWVEAVSGALPVATLDELTAVSEKVWNDLGTDDWLEAFRAHPRIGGRKAPQEDAKFASWSAGEQAGVGDAEAEIRALLAELNDAYFEKHGFIFIICASGKSASEMLAALQTRLENDTETELRNAAVEQAAINKIRLAKLVDGK